MLPLCLLLLCLLCLCCQEARLDLQVGVGWERALSGRGAGRREGATPRPPQTRPEAGVRGPGPSLQPVRAHDLAIPGWE